MRTMSKSTRMPTRNKKCLIEDCQTNKLATTDGCKFFTVPQIDNLRSEWLQVCATKRSYARTTTLYVCERHFDLPEDLLDEKQLDADLSSNSVLKLKRDVYPHKNLTTADNSDDESETDSISNLKTDHEEPAPPIDEEVDDAASTVESNVSHQQATVRQPLQVKSGGVEQKTQTPKTQSNNDSVEPNLNPIGSSPSKVRRVGSISQSCAGASNHSAYRATRVRQQKSVSNCHHGDVKKEEVLTDYRQVSLVSVAPLTKELIASTALKQIVQIQRSNEDLFHFWKDVGITAITSNQD